MCNLRIHELIQLKDSFSNNNLKVILFLQSPKEDILTQVVKDQEFPFTVIADPEKKIYNQYGLYSSMVATMRSMTKVSRIIKGLRAGFKMIIFQRGDMHLMPADFLINTDGIIEQAYYGTTSGDHIETESILEFAKSD